MKITKENYKEGIFDDYVWQNVTVLNDYGDEFAWEVYKLDSGEVVVRNNDVSWCNMVTWDYKYSWCIVNHSLCFDLFTKNVILPDSKGKTARDRYSYKTIHRRSDGIDFEEDNIDGDSIESLKKRVKELRAEAKKIQWLLKSHKNLFG